MLDQWPESELFSEGLFFEVLFRLEHIQVNVHVKVDSLRIHLLRINGLADDMHALGVLVVGNRTDSVALEIGLERKVVFKLFFTQIFDSCVVWADDEKFRVDMVLGKSLWFMKILFVLVRVIFDSVFGVKDLWSWDVQSLCAKFDIERSLWHIGDIWQRREHLSHFYLLPIHNKFVAISILNGKCIAALYFGFTYDDHVVDLHLNYRILTFDKGVVFLLNTNLSVLYEILSALVKLYPFMALVVDYYSVVVALYNFISLPLCSTQ